MAKFSVIIRARNEERYIGHAIQSLSDNIRDEIELIIIDNNSTDDTMRVVNLFEYFNPKIIKIDGPDYSPGLSLNVGVRNSNNEKIIILSAHCQITSWSSSLVQKCFENNNTVAIFGKQKPVYFGKKITPRYLWSHFDDIERKNYYSDLEKRYFLHNAFAVYKKSALEKYPFDDMLHGKEDRYWANDIIKKGKNFIYTPDLSCFHYYTSNGNTWKGVG